MSGTQILKSSRLSITAGRVEILRVLIDAQLPLSEKEVEDRMILECNRTTIYRTLNTLVEKGVIYRIVTDGLIKYKYTGSTKEHKAADQHVHFKCTMCNRVMCLRDVRIQEYSLPKGFTGKENQFLIVGICSDCNLDK